jgi:hypothetical protein
MKTDPRKQLLKKILSGRVPAAKAAQGLSHPSGAGMAVRFATFTNTDGVVSGEGYSGLKEEELPGVIDRMREGLKAKYYGQEPLLWVEVRTYEHE